MTTASPTPDEIIEQLEATWTSTAELCASLDVRQWRSETGCPGWDVRAQVAHMIGTEAMLAGEPTPEHSGEYPEHARNDIGKFNEHWVGGLAELGDDELLERFRTVTAGRLEALRALPQAEWDKEGPTPVGNAPYRRFMEVRVFDCWAHEQDIRAAVGRPGHDTGPAVDRSVDEVVGALGYLMGKRAKLDDGSSVRFAVGDRTIDVAVDGRAKVVEALAGDPTVSVRTDPVTFVRLACGRLTGAEATAEGLVRSAGDAALAERVLGSMTFTM